MDLRLSTKIRSPLDAVMGHVTQSEAWHSIGAGGSIDPPYKSEPSTSEDENADLRLFGFYEAAGMGALDHRDVGWTV